MTAYRVPVLERFAWQEPVLASVLAPLVSTKGTRYIVKPGATGDFVGQDNKIAWMDDAGWQFDAAFVGWKVYDLDSLQFYVFDGAIWSSASVFDGITIKGDITTDETEVDWDLMPGVENALSFHTPTDVNLLNFETTVGAEVVSTEATLKLDGDIDLSTASREIELVDGATDALVFSHDSTSIITIDTANLKTSFDRDVVIAGNLTVQGATTTIETTDLVVEDRLITLNKGGAGAGGEAYGSGIEFEFAGAPVGYIKTGDAGNDFVLNAPENDFVLTIDIDADSTLQMVGDLTVEAASIVDQDLTKDSTSVEFAALKLTGDIDLSSQDTNIALGTSATALTLGSILAIDTSANSVDITGDLDVSGVTTLQGNIVLPNAITSTLKLDEAAAISFDSSNLAGIMSVDTRTDAEVVNFGRDLAVAGSASITGDVNVTNTTSFSDGVAAATVAEMETSYDSRGQWDEDLKVLRFVVTDVYVGA